MGGCVRDSLLGPDPRDWDVATSALPEETAACFAGLPQVDAGKKHGTVAVVLSGQLVEITTYRVDGAYSDSRHPRRGRLLPPAGGRLVPPGTLR